MLGKGLQEGGDLMGGLQEGGVLSGGGVVVVVVGGVLGGRDDSVGLALGSFDFVATAAPTTVIASFMGGQCPMNEHIKYFSPAASNFTVVLPSVHLFMKEPTPLHAS